jgi:hypothetical protein
MCSGFVATLSSFDPGRRRGLPGPFDPASGAQFKARRGPASDGSARGTRPGDGPSTLLRHHEDRYRKLRG